LSAGPDTVPQVFFFCWVFFKRKTLFLLISVDLWSFWLPVDLLLSAFELRRLLASTDLTPTFEGTVGSFPPPFSTVLKGFRLTGFFLTPIFPSPNLLSPASSWALGCPPLSLLLDVHCAETRNPRKGPRDVDPLIPFFPWAKSLCRVLVYC